MFKQGETFNIHGLCVIGAIPRKILYLARSGPLATFAFHKRYVQIYAQHMALNNNTITTALCYLALLRIQHFINKL